MKPELYAVNLSFVLMMKERAPELVRGHEAEQVLWLLDFPSAVT